MPDTDKTIYASFCDFVEKVILPRLVGKPDAIRLDYREKGGNLKPAGYFKFGGMDWKCHFDTHFEPLLLAYYQKKFVADGSAFFPGVTMEDKQKLEQSAELQCKRTRGRQDSRYVYAYEKP